MTYSHWPQFGSLDWSWESAKVYDNNSKSECLTCTTQKSSQVSKFGFHVDRLTCDDLRPKWSWDEPWTNDADLRMKFASKMTTNWMLSLRDERWLCRSEFPWKSKSPQSETSHGWNGHWPTESRRLKMNRNFSSYAHKQINLEHLTLCHFRFIILSSKWEICSYTYLIMSRHPL